MSDPSQRILVWLSRLGQRRRLTWLLLPISFAVVSYYGRVLDRVYPLQDWLFWPIAYLWVGCAVFSLACVSLGHLVLSGLLRKAHLPTLESLVTSFAIGVVGFTLLMYLAGALGWYRTWFAIALPSAMIAAGALPLLRFCRERYRSATLAPAGSTAILVAGGGGVCLTLVYLGVMTPDAINFDAAWYHLAAAQDFAREGRLVPFYSDYNRALPQLATIAYTWCWLLPGLTAPLRPMMALHLEFFFFLWTLAGVAAAARWMLVDLEVRSTWAAFFLFPAIFVYDHNLGGAADHVVAVFAAPCFLAAVRALPAFTPRSCALVGVAFAGATLTKYQAVYMIGGAGLILLGGWLYALFRWKTLRTDAPQRVPLRNLLAGPAVLVATFTALTAPHFVKNILFHHNPVYPFAQQLFRGSFPQHPKSLLFMQTIYSEPQFELHGTLLERIRAALRLGLTCSFEPHYSFTNNVPMLGSLFVLLAPFALFVVRPSRIWLGLIAGYTATVVWAMTYVVDRYLQAIVPLLAATTAAIIVRTWSSGWVARVALLPPLLLQLVWSGDTLFYSSAGRVRSSISMFTSGFDKRIKDRFRYRTPYFEASEWLPEDARLLYHCERNNLGIDRPLVFDAANQQGLVYYDDLRGPRALYDYYKSMGITHLAWLQPTAVMNSKQSEVLFAELATNTSSTRQCFSELCLTQLSEVPPPPDSEYLVLLLGTAYPDGLYRVDQLTVHEAVPRSQYPAPLESLAGPGQAQSAMLRARAVVAAERYPFDPAVGQALQDFTRGMQYRGHDVYIRRRPGPAAQ